MTHYDVEQTADARNPDTDRAMDTDLRPWIRENLHTDAILTEYPYYQYKPDDHPDVIAHADQTNQDPADIPIATYVRQEGPYRTDLVAVDVDRFALEQRINRVGHATSMNTGPKHSRQRKYLRAYCDFVRDGPMDRGYYLDVHGQYARSTATTTWNWLTQNGFLIPVPRDVDRNESDSRAGGTRAYAAIQIPLHIDGGVHALELKRAKGEWETALEQADRARCYADFKWVVYDSDVAGAAIAHERHYRERGVGLMTLHPDYGVDVIVEADRVTPDLTDDLLSRWVVERWDVNERVLDRLDTDDLESSAELPAAKVPVHTQDGTTRVPVDTTGQTTMSDHHNHRNNR